MYDCMQGLHIIIILIPAVISEQLTLGPKESGQLHRAS